jgi:hypothetical protein
MTVKRVRVPTFRYTFLKLNYYNGMTWIFFLSKIEDMEEGSSDEYESEEDDVSQAPQAIGKPVVAVGKDEQPPIFGRWNYF